MTISVIVPVLNEAPRLAAQLERLGAWRARGAQIIVVDGGSTDNTCELAAPRCDVLLRAERGRARQMNAGAAHATGRLVVFLHADVAVPDSAAVELFGHAERLAAAPEVPLWGRFSVRLSGHGVAFRIIERAMNLRSKWTGVATGDQTLFVSTALFEASGGFPQIDLMEDVALTKKLRRYARPLCSGTCVTVSSRRWEAYGIWSTVALMWYLRAAYLIGVDPKRLHALYYHRRNARDD